jgi:response regulator RpfG family c-di-GMP phosphodiesterase
MLRRRIVSKGFALPSAAAPAQTVLVVDDSDDARESMRLQLRLALYSVLEAREGAKAVEAARRECPHLIWPFDWPPGRTRR